MTTPAERRFNQMSAKKASASADPGVALAGASNAYELMLAKLNADRRRLHDIQSIERKIDVKREILPDYDDWVVGALKGGRGGQDDVLVTVMIWAVDVGYFDPALDIAQYVLVNSLTMPDQYQRSVATVLVDEIANAALAQQRLGAAFDIHVLERLRAMTQDEDMPDQARAKLHKALGTEYRRAENYSQSAIEYRRALELHDGAGCKRDLADVERLLNKQGA